MDPAVVQAMLQAGQDDIARVIRGMASRVADGADAWKDVVIDKTAFHARREQNNLTGKAGCTVEQIEKDIASTRNLMREFEEARKGSKGLSLEELKSIQRDAEGRCHVVVGRLDQENIVLTAVCALEGRVEWVIARELIGPVLVIEHENPLPRRTPEEWLDHYESGKVRG